MSYRLFFANRGDCFSGIVSTGLPGFEGIDRLPPGMRPKVRILPEHRRTHVTHYIQHCALEHAGFRVRRRLCARVSTNDHQTLAMQGRADAGLNRQARLDNRVASPRGEFRSPAARSPRELLTAARGPDMVLKDSCFVEVV